MTTPRRSAVTAAEALVVIAVCFGWAIASSLQSVAAWSQRTVAGSGAARAATSGFTDAGLLSLVATEAVLAAVVLGFLAWRRYDVSGLYPQPTARGFLQGLALYAAGVLLYSLLVAALRSSPAQEPIQAMVRGASVSVGPLVAMAVVNGAYEEIFLLGVLGRGLRAHGQALAVGIPLLVRLLYHLYQGPVAATSVCLLGMVWGFYHFRSQTLFPVVFAHIVADVVPFVGH